MAFMLDAACGCNIGKLRTNNEDNCYFNGQTLPENNPGIPGLWHGCFREETVCFGVFDGMGGEEDGQLASFLAAQSFASDCRQTNAGAIRSGSLFMHAVTNMNIAVYSEAERRGNKMGTTAVLMGVCSGTAIFCNVGDSRAYRFRDGRLMQISKDHLETFLPFARGVRVRKARLSQCIGISPEELALEPHYVRDVLRDGDRYLLCSDGLTDMLSADAIRAVLEENSDVCAAVQRLIECALENGGKDNVTALLVKAISEPA